jgi:hypothetical protein
MRFTGGFSVAACSFMKNNNFVQLDRIGWIDHDHSNL